MKKLASILSMTAMFIAMMASVAFAADDTTAAIDTGDTAWVLISAALVFIMTPGLAFFYGGMVRSKKRIEYHNAQFLHCSDDFCGMGSYWLCNDFWQ